MCENAKNIEKVNMRFTTVLWLTLCICSMTVMLWFSANKTIVIADEGISEKKEEMQAPVMERQLIPMQTEGVEKSFSVRLPQDVKAGNIVMENHYADGELWLHIKSTSDSFYEDCTVTGDVSPIRSGKCGKQEQGVLLKLEMDDMYEYRSTMEGSMLVIAYDTPGAMYEKIIVLDPVGGGEEHGLVSEGTNVLYEKDVTLEIAKQVQKKLSPEGVKVYLTRTDDRTLSKERRLDLIQASDADLYIRIGVSASEESAERYGINCYYNEAFYLPNFGNVQLADIVAREVTIAAGNKAEGLFPAGRGNILQEIKIPATQLNVGYFTNEKERELLSRSEYREKLAKGIADAIAKACESLAETESDKTEEK